MHPTSLDAIVTPSVVAVRCCPPRATPVRTKVVRVDLAVVVAVVGACKQLHTPIAASVVGVVPSPHDGV
jgi:hypothetical protein